MLEINERYYDSGIPSNIFTNQPDSLVMNNLTSYLSLPLSQRGYTASNKFGLGVDGKRFIIFPIISGDEWGIGGGESYGTPDNKIATSQDYDKFLSLLLPNKQYSLIQKIFQKNKIKKLAYVLEEHKLAQLTLIASGKEITKELLKSKKLTDIVGLETKSLQEDIAPMFYIQGKFDDTTIDILTCK